MQAPRTTKLGTVADIMRNVLDPKLGRMTIAKISPGFFEAALISTGIVPKNYLLKVSERPEYVDEAIARLEAEGSIQSLTDPETKTEFLLIIDQGRPLREGRYSRRAKPPGEFKATGYRPTINLPLLVKDRNLLYHVGEGRLGRGAQIVISFVRRNLHKFKDQNPTVRIPKEFL